MARSQARSGKHESQNRSAATRELNGGKASVMHSLVLSFHPYCDSGSVADRPPYDSEVSATGVGTELPLYGPRTNHQISRSE